MLFRSPYKHGNDNIYIGGAHTCEGGNGTCPAGEEKRDYKLGWELRREIRVGRAIFNNSLDIGVQNKFANRTVRIVLNN